jgi:hypothetical protein
LAGQNNPSNVDLSSCILWDGGDEIRSADSSAITATYSAIQDDDPDDASVFAGAGNIDDDPMFVDSFGPDGTIGTSDDDLRLTPQSPAIDSGDPKYVPALGETDLDGNPRVLGCRVDMGAYEAKTWRHAGDFDRSGRIDLADFAGFQRCLGVAEDAEQRSDVLFFDADDIASASWVCDWMVGPGPSSLEWLYLLWLDQCLCPFDADGNREVNIADFVAFHKAFNR